MSSAGFLTLPNELLFQIAKELRANCDAMNLRATCTQLNLILEPLVLSKMTIDTRKHLTMLADLAENRTRAAYVRKLHIASLRTGARMCGCTVDDGSEPWSKEYLETALRSMQGVTSLDWTIDCDDPCWALETAIECLSTLTTVSELSVYLKGDWSKPGIFPIRKICHFKHLRACTIRVDDICLLLPITKAVIISNRPHLARLQLDGGFDVDHGAFDADLSQLFDDIPSGSASAITHLSLSKFLLGSAARILPHFGSLQSLQLNSCVPVDFWPAFSGSEIWLKDVVVDYVNQAFVEYLESYSGLERLGVSFNGIFVGAGSADNLSSRFYHSCLPQHKDSLKSLMLYPKTHGNWCFGNNNARQLKACSLLEELTVGVNLQDMNMESLLEVANSYSQLRTLKIVPRGPGIPWNLDACVLAKLGIMNQLMAASKSMIQGRRYEIEVLIRANDKESLLMR